MATTIWAYADPSFVVCEVFPSSVNPMRRPCEYCVDNLCIVGYPSVTVNPLYALISILWVLCSSSLDFLQIPSRPSLNPLWSLAESSLFRFNNRKSIIWYWVMMIRGPWDTAWTIPLRYFEFSSKDWCCYPFRECPANLIEFYILEVIWGHVGNAWE